MTPGRDFESEYRDVWTLLTQERLDQDRRAIPATLWHYTSVDGFDGILRAQQVRATDARFLNDALEFEYGLSLFIERLLALDAATLDSRTVEVLEASAATGWAALRGHLRDRARVFVTCFCEEPDLLSQWRAYASSGSQGVGYALGFNPKDVHGWIAAQTCAADEQLLIRRVIYDRNEQVALADAVISALVKQLDTAPEPIDSRTAFVRYLVLSVIDFAASIKHPSFAEEKEWRVILQRYSLAPDRALEFRPKNGVLVPYRSLSLPEPTGVWAGRLPVKSVMHGPTQDPELVKTSMRLFLDADEHLEDTQILGSNAPLRA